MTIDQTRTQGAAAADESGVCAQRNNVAFEAQMATRTVTHDAAFLLPYLRPGMELLDAGCGPGSITIGLAAVVAPSGVVGIDRQPAQVEHARSLAAERGIPNARFEVADIQQLPFPDGSFDAVFANGVLMHLPEPVRALRELRRVLRSGGVIGVRDPDFATNILAPLTPLMAEHLRTELALEALQLALAQRRPLPGALVHHTDRGCQYTAHADRAVLEHHGITPSMSRSGDCYDNAMAESFNATIKQELVARTHWPTRQEARAAVFEWITVFYNRQRRHSSIGYLSPVEFETSTQRDQAA
jgi:ubiquinone/menaquinone biosynthesis C-methylase UbiE